MKNQQGQTLIETIVAAFILSMGIGAALGLANYALSVSTNIRNQTIAMGLAREGVEVVKNVRDTNWLRDTLDNDCYNHVPGQELEDNAFCYRNWLNPGNGGQDIEPAGGSEEFIIQFDDAQSQPWRIVPNSSQYGLTASDGGTSGISELFYDSMTPVLATNASSGFARKITITEDDAFAPFNEDTGARVKVTSQVWWSGKNCQMTDDFDTNSSCSITLETYLTNWKNY